MNPESAPPSRDPWLRLLLILLSVIAGLYLWQLLWQLVAQFSDVILLFVFAWIISFVLEPSVATLSKWMPRALAVGLVYTGVLVALVAAGLLLLPALASQSTLAAERLPALMERVESWIRSLTSLLAERGLSVTLSMDQILRPLEAIGPALAANALNLATGVAAAATQVLLIIILSVYFVLDRARISVGLMAAVPARYRTDFAFFSRSVYSAFAGFVRGQIIQAVVYGAGVAVVMLFTDLPFGALASVISGVAMFIPFVGPPLSIVPPLLAVLATDVSRIWVVLIPTIALNVLVVNVVAPKVMSQQIGLHPIVVLSAVLVGAKVAGVWGALFGVPVAAVIAAMASFYRITVAEGAERVRAAAFPEVGRSESTSSTLEATDPPTPTENQTGAT